MIRRFLPPFWLAAPSRYAAVPTATARLCLAVLAAAVLASWTALAVPPPAATVAAPGDGTDLQLYAAIADALRHGGSYYPVAADALRSGGYPLRPFVTFRLPTLAVVQGLLPAAVVTGLLYALAMGVFAAWVARLREAFARPLARWAAALLLAGGAVACWQAELAPFHEVWAGLLIALSLARHRPDGWGEAIGWGLAAALIRETAALYLVVMLLLALCGNRAREGGAREAGAWAAALAVLTVAVAAHAHAVAQVVGPLDPASPGWAGMLGPGFAVRSWRAATALSLLPLAIAGPLVALAIGGWTAWRDPLGVRVGAVLATYGALLAVAGRADTFYWGLLTAPVLLIGLAFAPDGLRDLTAAALDRRRITVRRVVS